MLPWYCRRTLSAARRVVKDAQVSSNWRARISGSSSYRIAPASLLEHIARPEQGPPQHAQAAKDIDAVRRRHGKRHAFAAHDEQAEVEPDDDFQFDVGVEHEVGNQRADQHDAECERDGDHLLNRVFGVHKTSTTMKSGIPAYRPALKNVVKRRPRFVKIL